MKTRFAFLLLLLPLLSCIAQIPSINETLIKGKHDATIKTEFDKSFTAAENRTWYSGDFRGVLTASQANQIAQKFAKRILAQPLLLEHIKVFTDTYQKEIEEFREKIKELDSRLDDNNTLQEEVELTATIRSYENRILLREQLIEILTQEKRKSFKLFPTFIKNKRKAFNADFFSESETKTNYLNNLAFMFGSTTIQSELVSDYAGPFRLSLGTVINVDNEEDEEDGEEPVENDETNSGSEDGTLKRILSGGGNFYLNAMLPVHAYRTTGSAFSELTTINLNLSADIEGVGRDVETTNVRGLVNLSTYLSLSSDTKRFNFFVNADYGVIIASNDFVKMHQLEDFNIKPPFFGKAIIGFTLQNKFRLAITTKSISNYKSLINDSIMVGIQLLN